ncbi:Sushi, von Willebrand factor type A, EGF and pentraxin domain containing 1 [Desmophyllum pertusum]|uniref:Sushi, von Willebrand factor type A, EGF and pentraxin domain containing 1 n=1 Tax=Desmophyllum pertusum TaxID=174260 RepID=A0A9X0CYK4_9CNID|nr:Sushi, von Willebrand factor type A, EGF and pentraxin domain containing 1 [Desmophyllum pertusum]
MASYVYDVEFRRRATHNLSNKWEKQDFQLYVCVSVQMIASLVAHYALQFPQRGTSDYVITRGIRILTAVTVCFRMKSSDTGNEGTPLSYAVSGTDNELLVYSYRNFELCVGGSCRYKHSLAT